MNREEKAAVIDQIAGEFGESEAIFALDYRGITVSQVAELRDKLRPVDAKLRVTKNSLAERAADQADVGDVKGLLSGPTALAFVKGDAAAAAKVLSDTSKALRGPLTFKGGYMGGELLSAAQIDAIAKLPTREVLYGQLVGTIASPIGGLARTLNALVQGLAVQLGQIAEQGLVPQAGAAGAAPAEEAPAAEETPAADAEAAAEPAAEADAPADAEAPEAAAEATESESTDGASDDEPSDA
jgi:large subunit ribosomal protein L10